ncbi:MAG: hypothetical protein HY873_07390 [Chloroflexi bacterium]|nr:hypothetical protein [Chloroflexota bacterium]
MRRCGHCWHRYRSGRSSGDPMRGELRAERAIAEIAGRIFADPGAQDLWLLFCCTCRETRVVPVRAWLESNLG